jgi:hypothetical protein
MTTTSDTTVHTQPYSNKERAMTSSDKNSVQTRTGRCQTHGVVEGTRKMPRLLFPFIITGALQLVAMTRPYRCPRCGASTGKA